MVPVAVAFFLFNWCDSKYILTSLICQILTAGLAILNSVPPPPLSFSLNNSIVSNTDCDIGHHISWKYSTVNGGQYQVAPEEEADKNARWLQSYMIIILFIISERGSRTQCDRREVIRSWRSHSYNILYICVCKGSAFMYIYRSAYITPCTPISSHSGCNTFNIAKHERLGYKLAFQPDISDMISASHLVSLLFVSPVDFVQFELLLLRMQRSLPQAPQRCEKDASEELFLKSSSSSEAET